MNLSSLIFIFAFLPLSLILYYVVPGRFRNIPMVLLSLVFYAWGSSAYLVLLLLSMAFNYVSGLQMGVYQREENLRMKKVTLIVGIVGNVLLLGFFKYLGFLLSTLSLIPGISLTAPQMGIPLGLSFYTFSVLSYLIDVYRGTVPAQRNLLSFMTYAAFFPKITSGPIVAYHDMAEQIDQVHAFSMVRLGRGANLFVVGLAKKVLLADQMGVIFASVTGQPALSVGSAWLGVLLYTLQLYFDFSGYSDMAIGLACMFGYDFDKNFDYPYCSTNISEFWRRWHISLGAWFRNYIYIPLGGNRVAAGRLVCNLLVVWLLTGLWHGASWSFIAWGLWHGLFVILERFVIRDRLDGVPRVLRILTTDLIVLLGWVLFFSGTMSNAVGYFGQMFGAGHLGLFDATFLYYLKSSLVLVVLGILGSSPRMAKLQEGLVYRQGGRRIWISIALYVVLFALCVAAMVSATYSSFLYVQF